MHSGSMLRGQGAQWVNSERSGLHSGSEAQSRIELRLSTWGGSNSCVHVCVCGGATMWSSGHSVKLCYIIIPDKELSVSFSSSLTHFSSLTNLMTSVAQTGEDSVTLAASVHSCVCACVSECVRLRAGYRGEHLWRQVSLSFATVFVVVCLRRNLQGPQFS